jgi:hypothetical protein
MKDCGESSRIRHILRTKPVSEITTPLTEE